LETVNQTYQFSFTTDDNLWMYHGRRNQGCITLLASVISPYKTNMIVLADNSPLTDDDDDDNLWKYASNESLDKLRDKLWLLKL
jgi:hypothetical protein